MIHAEAAPHHLADERDGHRRGVVTNLDRQLVRFGEQNIRIHDLADEAAMKRFLRVEDAARVTPFQRLADADNARQEEAGRRFRHDAATREHEAETRILRSDADIHGELHGETDADRRAVHRADDGLEALIDRQRHPAAAVAHALVAVVDGGVGTGIALGAAGIAVGIEGGGAGGKIGAGAEGPAGAGHDDGAHFIVAIHFREHVDHLVHHRAGEGVELLRTMQSQGEDLVLHRNEDFLVGAVGHMPSPMI